MPATDPPTLPVGHVCQRSTCSKSQHQTRWQYIHTDVLHPTLAAMPPQGGHAKQNMNKTSRGEAAGRTAARASCNGLKSLILVYLHLHSATVKSNISRRGPSGGHRHIGPTRSHFRQPSTSYSATAVAQVGWRAIFFFVHRCTMTVYPLAISLAWLHGARVGRAGVTQPCAGSLHVLFLVFLLYQNGAPFFLLVHRFQSPTSPDGSFFGAGDAFA